METRCVSKSNNHYGHFALILTMNIEKQSWCCWLACLPMNAECYCCHHRRCRHRLCRRCCCGPKTSKRRKKNLSLCWLRDKQQKVIWRQKHTQEFFFRLKQTKRKYNLNEMMKRNKHKHKQTNKTGERRKCFVQWTKTSSFSSEFEFLFSPSLIS